MRVKTHANNLKVIFNFNEDLISKIKKIPGAKYNPSSMQTYWSFPASSLSYAKRNKIISEGILFPDAKKHINTDLFQELSIEIKPDKLKATGPSVVLSIFEKSIQDLCSYEEKIDNIYMQKTLAETIYNKNGTLVISFPVGLCTRVTAFCKYIRLKYIKIHKRDSEPSKQFECQVHNYKPRPYQQKAVEKIQSKAIPPMGTLVMATGSGKTILSALITANIGVQTIFYVYSNDLLKQTKKVYEEVLQQEIGIIGGSQFSIKPITIASMQTVHGCHERQDKRWEKLKEYLDCVQLVFIDEGHMLGAETVYTVANLSNAYYSYSLTATPFREDGKEIFIEAATGPAIELIKEDELIAGGYVLPVEIEMYPIKHYPPKRKKKYSTQYNAEIIDDWDRHRAVVNAAKRYAGKQTIILVKELRHGYKLRDNLLCPFIHGKSTSAERTLVLDQFKSKEINLLIASSILKQGVDIPEAEVLILAHGGSSLVELLQKLGRVRRPADGKKAGIVVDFYDYIAPAADNDIFKNQSKKRLALYRYKNFAINWTTIKNN